MTRFFAGICGVDKADMKFKNKIIISFCIIIFIPILLAVAVLFGFQKIQLKSIEQTYGVESDDYSYFSNSMQLLSRFTRESFETLLDLSTQDPDRLEDKAFLEQMNDTLREKYSYLVVRRGDELIYVGDEGGVAADGSAGLRRGRVRGRHRHLCRRRQAGADQAD